MSVTFLTPLAFAFVVLALLPMAVSAARQRRARRIRGRLGLREPSRWAVLPMMLALGLVPVLAGVAATQPVITRARIVPERTDAQVFIVLDISRSMLASKRPGSPTRFERARAEALALQQALPGVPVGLASVTDRLLPHLFPTTDATLFEVTAKNAIGIERPPPASFYSQRATKLDSLGAAARLGYFSPKARKRVLVVFTDGETQPLMEPIARDFARRPRIHTVFVHVGDSTERIYESGVAEQAYRSDPDSVVALRKVADLVSGGVLEEGATGKLAARVREALGSGPTVDRRHEGERFALMPYVALAALLPLAFVLYRRNL